MEKKLRYKSAVETVARIKKRKDTPPTHCQLALVFILFFVGQAFAQDNPLRYKNPALPVEERIQDLISRMTLEEKVAQVRSTTLNEKSLKNGQLTLDQAQADALKHGIGALQKPGSRGMFPKEGAAFVNAIQKFFVEETRLGIPILIQEEVLVGHLAKGSTTFPQPLALSCSWDTALVKEVYTTIAREARARGGNHALTPNLDVARDPRWGRMEETYGEDSYLTSRMAVAAITGMQGDDARQGVDAQHIASTAKHFLGYGQGAGGRNFAPTQFNRDELYNDYLPPFRAVIQEAHLLGVMPSHSTVEHIPAHSNEWLLTTLLRDTLGFQGVVVSDYYDISRLEILYHVAENEKEAVAQALRAGVDLDLPQGLSYQYLPEIIPEKPELLPYLDRAVASVLRVKFLLGLFENPYADAEAAEKSINTPAHREVALKAAERSIVLLKNEAMPDGKKLLPLDIKAIKSMAVIGPNAHPVHYGGYSLPYNITYGTSVLEGIKSLVGDKVRVEYAQGSKITQQDPVPEVENNTTSYLTVALELADPEENRQKIAEAVAVAKRADVAIVCIGDNYLTTREAIFVKEHLGDRANLELLGQQNELVRRVIETGTPTVVVLLHGRSLTINEIAEKAPAILDGWYLGQETGTAVANTLFGQNNPAGKLTVTVPRTVGQLPVYYSQRSGSMHKGYLFEDNTLLFHFGHGLSYTQFDYTELTLSKNKITEREPLQVQVNVKNTGPVAGDEIVQLYVRDQVASIIRPEQELKGFQRIHLEPGAQQTVTFTLPPSKLGFYDADGKWVVESGAFDVSVGRSSVDVMTKTFIL